MSYYQNIIYKTLNVVGVIRPTLGGKEGGFRSFMVGRFNRAVASSSS